MQHKLTLVLLFSTLISCLCRATLALAQSPDIIIYGATPAGIATAVSATQEGKRVLVLNPYENIGGIISAGLGASDVCQHRVIGGFSRKFFERVGAHYQQPISWGVEPKVAEAIFKEILEEHKIKIIPNSRITTVELKKNKITAVSDQNKIKYQGKIFIDASYEGDLLALAKVPYSIGRESQTDFNEASAGVFHLNVRDQFLVPVPAQNALGETFPLVSNEKLAALGTGDKRIMAYNYRPCITKVKDNRVEFYAPENYQAAQFSLLSEYLKLYPKAKYTDFLRPLQIPNEKFDLNNRGPISTDYIGANYAYPEATYSERLQIEKQHRDYILGLLYFLSHDPSVPLRLRTELSEYGYCKDEFTTTKNFPQLIYVREARRMRGEYVLTQLDLTHKAKKSDAIALASCPIESHHVQRVATSEGVKLEGWVSERITPYHIPYRSTTPKKKDLTNLLVAVTISATHIANSSLRMEPTYMIIGESLGIAASMAIDSKQPVQDIDMQDFNKRLLARGQILSVPAKALKYAQAHINLDRKHKKKSQAVP